MTNLKPGWFQGYKLQLYEIFGYRPIAENDRVETILSSSRELGKVQLGS